MRFLKFLADRFKKWSIGESPEALGSLYVCRFGVGLGGSQETLYWMEEEIILAKCV